MQRVVLLSDVHLGGAPSAVNALFAGFIKNLDPAEVSALYILGDLFEAWPGDDEQCEAAQEAIAALKALTARGVPLFIQHGNRDFLLGVRFVNACGATLLPEAHVLSDSAGGRWLLMHGDSLVADSSYLRYRRWIRHPLAVALVSLLPLSWRRWAASRMRAASRGSRKKAEIDDAQSAALLRQHDCFCLVHGHLHREEARTWQEGGRTYRRRCLPEWLPARAGYGEIVHGEFHLRQLAAAAAA